MGMEHIMAGSRKKAFRALLPVPRLLARCNVICRASGPVFVSAGNSAVTVAMALPGGVDQT